MCARLVSFSNYSQTGRKLLFFVPHITFSTRADSLEFRHKAWLEKLE